MRLSRKGKLFSGEFSSLNCFNREISSLEEGTKTYESVGRMFVLTPITQVKENLQKKQTQSEEKIKVLVNNKTYLENSLKDATNSLRELVQQKKEA